MGRSNLAGALAPQYPQRQVSVKSGRTKTEIAPISAEERAARLRNQEILKAGKRQQIKSFIVVVAFVLFLTGLFGYLLGIQTSLIEMNFANAKIEKQIAKLKIENVQKNSELVAATDLEAVRERALELGMQDPLSNQVIYLDVPTKDRLILGQKYSNLAQTEEAGDASVMDNIEAFFKSFLP